MFLLLAKAGPFPPDAILLLFLISALPTASGLILAAFFVRCAARRLGKRSFAPSSWIERKWLFRTSSAILTIYALALAYGIFVESQWVELTTTEIRVREPVLGQERFRIVHLSDLHLRRIRRCERRVMELVHEAKPDLILITGDYGNSGNTPKALEEMLRGLLAPYGLFGVTGNNDAIFPNRALLGSAGVVLLQNETKLIERMDHRLRLVGQDFQVPVPLRDLLGGEKEEAYTIFLAHKPDAADELGRLGPGQHVDLFLCGHTHGGQICLPLWGAIVTESKYHKKYERGIYDVNGVPMYVNRGIGEGSFPIRFFARPEVAVIDLVHR